MGHIGLSFTLVTDLGNIASVSVDRVRHLLHTTVREQGIVRATGGVTIPSLLLAVVVVCVVVLHGPVVCVGGGGGLFLRGVGCRGSIRPGEGADNGKEASGC